MNSSHRKPLPGTELDYFDARAAIEALRPGAYRKLPYTSRVLAEQLVRRCDPATLDDSLQQIIGRQRDLDFPWYPARVVCHDILGQTALVDLAGLRDAIAEQGGDPAKVNPVVPTQLIVDHSLAVEAPGFDPEAFEKNRAIEDRRNEDRFYSLLSSSYLMAGDMEEARRWMEKAGQIAVEYSDQRKYNRKLEMLMEMDPGDP